jgi:mRNA interferase RelE/StbE
VNQYRMVFSASAKRDFDKLDRATRQRIAKKLRFFLEQDDPLGYARPLVHASIGGYRFRIGHFRVIFDVDDETIQVLSVRHRRDVYRG